MENEIINVTLSDDKTSVRIIDQTLLPNEIKYIKLKTREELFEAIYKLRVRGAPAIGIFAGFSMYVLARGIRTLGISDDEFIDRLKSDKDYLNSSRPTAVNLSAMLNRCFLVAKNNIKNGQEQTVKVLLLEAENIQQEDIYMCKKISEYGLTLIKDNDTILTHCNAGPLATSKYGTGLGALILGAEKGMKLKAFCDETRPLLQGARLTTFELINAGIDTTLICDNMAGHLMNQGKIDACFVGCDRVARNGDTANKIGTSSVAVLAKYYNVPFYVFCPSSTIDLSCESGKDIVIEERDGEEIKTKFFKNTIAPKEVKCYNPAFDVTDAKLITAIITENAIYKYPYNFNRSK